MDWQSPRIRTRTADIFAGDRPTYVPQPVRPPTPRSPPPPQSLNYSERCLACPQPEALLLNTYFEPWETPRKTLRKMPKSSSLSLAMRAKGGKDSNATPMSPRSPGTPDAVYGNDSEAATPVAAYHTMPESPASPRRKDSKSIFSNFHASKSSSRIISPDNSIRQVPEQNVPNTLYTNGRNGGSTPELNRPIKTPNSEDNRFEITNSESGKSNEISDHNSESNNAKGSAAKPKKQGMLSRSRSIKVDPAGDGTKVKGNPPKYLQETSSASWKSSEDSVPLKTAPLEKGQSWRQNISFGKLRTHSADRHDGSQREHGDDDSFSRRDKAEQSSLASGSFNESRGAALMSSLGSGARKMGEKMETARKGMFGKLGRSSSNHEKDLQIPKEQYQFKIINLGLVEQTRLTRISSRLENSKDKTEFWMPALPWRCIDYLNMKGCEEEGLYRVPGAAHTVRYYEQKFDQDRDIDLIADDNLNDPNVIGSLFKNWLRQLPDEIFPKATQARIQQECQGAKTTPQMLKDELSKLPPFNYYLLFAITCHISLLHSCSEFNKMNYNNLCICFQPAIKIDAFCFQFLILDWRNCWQGCWTEKEYLAEEVKLLEAEKPQSTAIRNGHNAQSSGKAKSLHSTTGHLGEGLQLSSPRSISADRAASSERSKPSGRGISAEQIMVSGRATPPNPGFSAEHSSTPKRGTERGIPSDRESSIDRVISSSDSREGFNARGTPKRAPPAVSTDPSFEEEDNSATPTQAQHTRLPSETTFRLDLANPPSSPFSIKF
ncbi:hypothetical protein K469DRAFT_724139 [Zopfia rhizophila CBS 207.26]|uniref:Rho-GAP domain-containing protein n=1 Tax=Zopfia rhizophila CBS 207.26 TaxID=1314779 RepID=A0A6A6DAA7_9PEZI|nr:hypothetical protein K469DRAFT_724139 [Zopfia rhizophila CBS 207.26]